MNVFSWVAIGLIIGVFYYRIDKTELNGGLAGSIFLGILGAAEGGYFASFLFGSKDSVTHLFTFAIAFSGALLLLFLRKTFSYFNDEPNQRLVN